MLTVNNLYAGYGASEVLNGTSLTVKAGTLVALIGPNGAGKTTTMRSISGTIKPTKGEVMFDGKKVDGLPASNIAKLGLAHVPEGRCIFGTLSVEDNLLLGGYRLFPKFFGFHAKAKQSLSWVYSLFPRMQERKNQSAGTLSGGEQQMLAIGRALMADPKIILMDEPSMGLAPVIVDELFSIIIKLKETGIPLLLVEQAAKKAFEVADYVYVMEHGKIFVEGKPEDLKKDERIISAYLW